MNNCESLFLPRRRARKDCSSRALLEPLEPRVLYSADLWPVGASGDDIAVPNADLTIPALTVQFGDSARVDPQPVISETPSSNYAETEEMGMALSPISVGPDQSVTLLVIDAKVDDLDQLVRDTAVSSNQQLEVLLLSPNRDGIEQISQKLLSLHNVSAMHIVSHGSDGVVELGSTQLTGNNLTNYEEQLSAWKSSLTTEADILIYGCDLAASDKGITLLQSLATICDCDFAASNDLTGSSDLGGDWTLEYEVGEIETEILFSQSIQKLWVNSLDISSNLVGYWPLDGSVNDVTASANNGQFFSESYATLADGTSYAAQYDTSGASRYIEIPDNTSYDFVGDRLSISFWYNTTTLPEVGQRAILFQQFDGVVDNNISLNSSGGVRWAIDDGTSQYIINSGAVLSTGWHLVSVTKDTSNLALYVDGALRFNTGISSLGSLNSSAPITLGAASAGLNGFQGLQDDVRIYNRSLSSVDIQELYSTNLPPDPAYTITVTTTQDYPGSHAATGDTSSVPALLANKGADGLISLREAVLAANSGIAHDTIVLPPGLYDLSVFGSGENLANTGDLDITSEITIAGSGVANTHINGAMADRLLEVTSVGSLTLTDLVARGGDSGSYAGAAVANAGTLNATNVNFVDNVVSGNEGGAIFSSGVTNLDRVSLVNNSANNGGGLDVSAGTTTLTNVTVSGNTAKFDGGGIRTKGSGVVDISFSTIASNIALGGTGGGLRANTGTLQLSESIVGDNTAQFNGQDIFGTVVSGGNNIVEDAGSAIGLVATDTVGIDPSLAALAVDSPSGQYIHAIDSSSPAYDKISGGGPPVDQRGEARISFLDAGAYETSINEIYPTDLSSGIELNNDSGNDTYLTIQNAPAIFGGLSQITVEHQLVMADTDHHTLLSHSTPGSLDALQFEMVNGGFRLTVDGITTDLNAIDYATILGDGKRHTIAFTWDNVAGDVALYIDGSVVETKTGIARVSH